jgi:hypothetical protein
MPRFQAEQQRQGASRNREEPATGQALVRKMAGDRVESLFVHA